MPPAGRKAMMKTISHILVGFALVVAMAALILLAWRKSSGE